MCKPRIAYHHGRWSVQYYGEHYTGNLKARDWCNHMNRRAAA
jgi:hypothetical protein